jgi:16S rRNA (guanine(966)-N(2))-methyltransferase RsmD
MSIRIIAGECKGFILKGEVAGEITRPILARVKKSLFDILSPDLKDANFLDLFCGTGSVGIEAVSRGAKKAIFVDKDKNVNKCVKINIEYCKITDRCEVYSCDIFDFFKTYSNIKFDIIFAGPPYPANLCNNILKNLAETKFLKPETMIVLQHQIKEPIAEDQGIFQKVREKIYGDTKLSFFKIKQI